MECDKNSSYPVVKNSVNAGINKSNYWKYFMHGIGDLKQILHCINAVFRVNDLLGCESEIDASSI